MCLLLNHLGLVVDWAVDTANVHDGTVFQEIVDRVAEDMVVFADPHFKKKGWEPNNLKICQKGTWNTRMMVETVLSMLTVICHFKKVGHRVWRYFESRVGYTMALFNMLVTWHGIEADEENYFRLSIAEFSL